jgi:hypothetical protein
MYFPYKYVHSRMYTSLQEIAENFRWDDFHDEYEREGGRCRRRLSLLLISLHARI